MVVNALEKILLLLSMLMFIFSATVSAASAVFVFAAYHYFVRLLEKKYTPVN